MRRGAQEYEEDGKRFYKLAGEYRLARSLEMDDVFHLLHENFTAAKKPLNYISSHSLRQGGTSVF